MKKFKDTWLCEFIKSSVFIGFLFFVLLIAGAVFIGECKENKKVIDKQEDVLYMKPKADTIS